MMRRLKSRWALAGVTILALLSAACVQLAPAGWSRPASLTDVEGTSSDAAAGQPAMVPVNVQIVTDATPAVGVTTPGTGSASGRQVASVKRGPISEVLMLSGRVAGLEEVSLPFPVAGRVENVAVKPGQMVEDGQVLLEAESKEIAKELSAARTRLETSSIRLEQGHAQSQARQRETEARLSETQAWSEAERGRAQMAVADAETGLRRAWADLDRVKAGPSAAERQAAEGAVVSARAGVQRAEADLARLYAGPSDVDRRVAEQQASSARLALQRARADRDRLTGGADSAELRAAEREVASAQSALDRAQAEHERLARGADPAELRAAQRETERAENAVRAAESAYSREVQIAQNQLRAAEATIVSSASRNGGKNAREAEQSARVARDSAISNARLAVQAAEERGAATVEGARRDFQAARERLAIVQQGPKAWEVEVARRSLESAQLALQTANERLEAIRRGPDQLVLDTAGAAVERAQADVENAEARLAALQAGPSADAVSAANGSIASARATLNSALARQAELHSHPTPAELRDAEDRVGSAQVALARAQVELERASVEPGAPPDQLDAGAFDLILLEKAVAQDRGLVEQLERELAMTRLVAPFAGIVASVQVRSGDPLEAGRPALTLARPGPPIIRADADDRDAPRLAPGQQAAVLIEGTDGAPLSATIDDLLTAESGGGRVARLNVTWSADPPAYGTGAEVSVTLRHKEDVLIVPQRAIRSAGPRRYVEVIEDGNRRVADVQVGLIEAGMAEILSGLSEGQTILVGP